jgi:hypothetical protein
MTNSNKWLYKNFITKRISTLGFFSFFEFGGHVPFGASVSYGTAFSALKNPLFWHTLYKKFSTDGAEASGANFILNRGGFDQLKLFCFLENVLLILLFTNKSNSFSREYVK